MSLPYAEVIGDPVAHSKSPLIHRFWLDALGIAGDYRTCHVKPGELSSYLAERRQDADWRGCNVTIPHKQAVLPGLDGIDAKARAVGAVNCIVREQDGGVSGTNTDVDGVAEAVCDAALDHAVVLGAGGAARAAFAFLALRDAGVHVVARNRGTAADTLRACGLEATIHDFDAAGDALAGATLLINATQLGMSGQPAMPAGVIAALAGMVPDAAVFDMVYAPLETALLLAARGHGFRAVDGLAMLIGQAAGAFERFFGVPAPRERDDELRALLTS